MRRLRQYWVLFARQLKVKTAIDLTYKDDYVSIGRAEADLSKFLKSMSKIYNTTLAGVVGMEEQARGVIHWHLVIASHPHRFFPFEALGRIWYHGFVSVARINPARLQDKIAYAVKYGRVTSFLTDANHKSKHKPSRRSQRRSGGRQEESDRGQ